MKVSVPLLRHLRLLNDATPIRTAFRLTRHCPLKRNLEPQIIKQLHLRRFVHNPADTDPNWVSILDQPPRLISTKKKHSLGLYALAIIPVTAFALGCWQIQRLGWKTDLIARFEDRLIREPLPLPPYIDPEAVHDFDYRRVYATGRFRHDQEMLIGPRLHDGNDGYLVITPLERGDEGTKILVSRGWIAKNKKEQAERKDGLPVGNVIVQGLLREPWKKNMFTPANRPETADFHFPDVEQMAGLTGSQPIWVEETMRPDFLIAIDREAKGIPIGRPAVVNLRNTHIQYIFTWFSLSLATTIMLYMVAKKPVRGVAARVRQTREW